jgi:cytidyltransferase-like protein
MVSGCYDMLHAGHVRFLRDAKMLGDHLTVCVAGDEVIQKLKGRLPAIPGHHRLEVVRALGCVYRAVLTHEPACPGLDFDWQARRQRPDILAVTSDDQFEGMKRELCLDIGAQYVQLNKTEPWTNPISSTQIRQRCSAPCSVPLRVDLAGGWLDVPQHARQDGVIVNCAIDAMVSLTSWPYRHRSGLGGSAAWSILNGYSGVAEELQAGVGWQDAAVIRETGLCVWQSGVRPKLLVKTPGSFLYGLMALLWTGKEHNTPSLVSTPRDYDGIAYASQIAARGVLDSNYFDMVRAVEYSHELQVAEGMNRLAPSGFPGSACKYCGSGWGGYALYLFRQTEHRDQFVADHSDAFAIEPYVRNPA